MALTSFVGRDSELAEVKQRLRRQRLLTLTCTGGVGKTRLALEAAADVADGYPRGVWLVELGALAEAGLVAQAIATVLRVHEIGDRPLNDVLVAALRRRRILLILDTCEHLLVGCAALAEVLLRRCAGVQILATSRQPLGVPGEVVWRVPSLEVRSPHQRPPTGTLDSIEAARLFIERASSALPSFEVTPDNASAIIRLCHQLDGIPLAIELAAAQVSVMSVEEIAHRLRDHLQLLSTGSGTALARHQTLRGTFDWSYTLLTDSERVLSPGSVRRRLDHGCG